MNKTLVTILIFMGLLLFLISPFAALAGLMLILLVGALVSTILTLVRTLVKGDTTPSGTP